MTDATAMEPAASPVLCDDRMLIKLRKMLAKAESSTFPAEAEAYMEKVSKLAAAMGIDDALLWAAEDPASRGVPTSITFNCYAPYAVRKAVLVNSVATPLGCRIVREHTRSNGTIPVVIFGFSSDLKVVELLTTSLMMQMTSSMMSSEVPYPSPSATAAWRRSFITAFAARIRQRLTQDRAEAAADPVTASPGVSGSMAVVLASRDREVNDVVRKRFPRLRNTYITHGGSSSGSAAGRAAGDRASLGGRGVKGASGSIGPGA